MHSTPADVCPDPLESPSAHPPMTKQASTTSDMKRIHTPCAAPMSSLPKFIAAIAKTLTNLQLFHG
jgi:hypothetical protein